MKYKVTAHLDFEDDIVELNDDLTEEEINKELFEYVMNFFDWDYVEVEE